MRVLVMALPGGMYSKMCIQALPAGLQTGLDEVCKSVNAVRMGEPGTAVVNLLEGWHHVMPHECEVIGICCMSVPRKCVTHTRCTCSRACTKVGHGACRQFGQCMTLHCPLL